MGRVRKVRKKRELRSERVGILRMLGTLIGDESHMPPSKGAFCCGCAVLFASMS